MNNLLPIENVNAVAIFSEGGLDKLLEQIHAEAESHVPDLETDKGRKAIASIAAKVAKSKTYLDGLGKDMVSGWKNQAKVVDAERRKMRDDLDELKATIRKPLTDWEDAENKRIEMHTDRIEAIIDLGKASSDNYLNLRISEQKKNLDDLVALDTGDCFDEFSERATEVKSIAIENIKNAIVKAEKHYLEQKELADLRAEKEERERLDREALEAKERADREKRIAEEAAEKARKDAEASEQKAIKDKNDAVERAEQAEQNARDKLAREQQAEREETERRERNTRHKGKVNSAAVDAIIEVSGINAEQGRKIVTAIAKGKIANVSISY